MHKSTITSPLNHLKLPESTAGTKSLQLIDYGYVGVFQILGSTHQNGQANSIMATSVNPGEATRTEFGTLFAVAPSQWLLISLTSLFSDIAKAVGSHANVVDLTFARNSFRLSGQTARTVLAKGCPLDLHPSSVQPGFCAQTSYHDISITLIMNEGEPDTFDIVCFSGFAESIWTSLMEAGAEFAIQASKRPTENKTRPTQGLTK